MALTTGTKITLVAVLVGASALLMFTDSGEGVLEYRYADDVMSAPQDYLDKEIKVHGKVVKGTITKRKASVSEYQFQIEHGGKSMFIHYEGIVPDTFQEEGEVVLTGKFTGDVFESNEMTAKCPSKYEQGAAAVPDMAARPKAAS